MVSDRHSRIEYSLYRPHRSLNLLIPVEYCSKLLNNKDPSMLQMYWTQTVN
jgi:transposase InsO family protein